MPVLDLQHFPLSAGGIKSSDDTVPHLRSRKEAKSIVRVIHLICCQWQLLLRLRRYRSDSTRLVLPLLPPVLRANGCMVFNEVMPLEYD